MAWYESLANMFDPVLTPVFFFILKMPAVFGIITIALIITLISTFIYKWVTDQDIMKSLKDEMKSLQKQVKEHKDDPKKMMALNKEMMGKNKEYMKHSFRPMMFTMLPILIIFGWVGGHLAYEPLLPEAEFDLTVMLLENETDDILLRVPEGMTIISSETMEPDAFEVKNGWFTRTILRRPITKYTKATWTIKGEEGDYAVQFEYDGKKYEKFVQITNEKRYASVNKFINDGRLFTINVENNPVKVFGLNWFWTYLIAAIAFNTALRKIMKLS